MCRPLCFRRLGDPRDQLLRTHDADGNRLTDAMTAAGLDPLRVLDTRRTPESMRAWLELHVEQGPVLEQTGNTIGVVDGISGVYKWIVRLIGEAEFTLVGRCAPPF